MNVSVELMQSQMKIGGKHYLALGINGKRHGPDAGPWDVIQTFSVPIDDLREAIATIEKGQEHVES